MASVTVKVNGRSYPIICGDGEEDHLTYLADYVDKKVKDLGKIANNATEPQLLLMATLLIADDLSQAYEKIDGFKENSGSDGTDTSDKTLNEWTDRLEAIAERFEKA
jgi:cell division protein ZapA